jgi:uroporphyrinogen III methyltransferase/synthase
MTRPGARVLVTRAGIQAARFTSLLQKAGLRVVEIPTIELCEPEDWGPSDRAIARLTEYRLIIFTSANGVERFLQRIRKQGEGSAALRGITLMAIGPVTAAALEERGLAAQQVPSEYHGEALLEAATGLLGRWKAGETPRVLIPRAAVARDVLPDGLRSAGVSVDIAPVYRSACPESSRGPLREALVAGLDAVTFTSSATVTNFMALAGGDEPARQSLRDRLKDVTIACIGPITAATAVTAGLEVHVQPKASTVDALASALIDRLRPGL